MRFLSLFLRFAFLLAATNLAQAQEAYLRLLKQDVSAYEQARTYTVPVADFDGDGLLDIAVPAHNYNESVVSIIGTGSQRGWRIKQTLVAHEPGNARWPIGLAAAQDATGAYLVLTKDSKIFVYGGWPLRILRILDVPNHWYKVVAVADIDFDGTLEIVTATDSNPAALAAHDLDSGAQEWSISIPALVRSILPAQLDSDSALEILAGGFVIDGATQATQWQYNNGIDFSFGLALAVGRFGGDVPRFVGAEGRIAMFEAAPWANLWESGDTNIESIAAVDLDGDDVDELVYPATYLGRLDVFDVELRAVRKQYQTGSVYRVAAGDFDGDASTEIALVLDPEFYPTGPSRFEIVNAVTGASEYTVAASRGGPYASALFRLDGEIQIAQASQGRSFRNTLPGLVRATSLAPEGGAWLTPPVAESDLLSGVDIRDFHALRLDGLAEPALVVTGRSTVQRVMAAFRSENGSRLWTRAYGSAVGSRYFEQSLPFDRNRDGTADSMFVCTNEQRVQEYRLADGELLWESTEMELGSCKSLIVVEALGSRCIVGVFGLGTRAFDVDTRELAWSMPGLGFGNTGGALIANGASGAELAIFDSSKIWFHDLATRKLLRTIESQRDLVAVHQPQNAPIKFLLVLEDSHLKVIDGITGAVRTASDPMGRIGEGRTLTSLRITDRRHVVSASAGVGSFAYALDIAPDGIFSDSFDRWITPQPISAH